MAKAYYSDQHIHTSFSGDSEALPESQIEKAISLGMESICITDHHDYDVVSDIDFNLNIPEYIKEMSKLKVKYSDKITVRIGIELGLQSHISEYLETVALKYPFDLIIGSIHFIDGLDPYYPEYFQKNGKTSYERYFETTLNCIKNIKCYDSLGHLDYIVRYGKKHRLSYSYSEYSDIIDEILRTVISDGKALECNSGGLMRGLDEPNPCFDVLKRYKELGGELITLGSDAHSPENMGCKFDICGELLKKAGFEFYAVYEDRKVRMYDL